MALDSCKETMMRSFLMWASGAVALVVGALFFWNRRRSGALEASAVVQIRKPRRRKKTASVHGHSNGRTRTLAVRT
jgi:hypothetical protein